MKTNYLIVGLTGGIAGGKSTVSKMFGELGARLIDFDALARIVVAPGSRGLSKVVETFGPQVLQSDGTLDRKKLSRMVFRDKSKRKVLESLLHPDINAEFEKKIASITSEKTDAIIVAEVPLLIEAGLQHLFDAIVVVVTSEQEQIRRLMNRDRITREKAAEMIEAQLPVEEKIQFADYLVANDQGLESTSGKVKQIWAELIALRQQRSS